MNWEQHLERKWREVGGNPKERRLLSQVQGVELEPLEREQQLEQQAMIEHFL